MADVSDNDLYKITFKIPDVRNTDFSCLRINGSRTGCRVGCVCNSCMKIQKRMVINQRHVGKDKYIYIYLIFI